MKRAMVVMSVEHASVAQSFRLVKDSIQNFKESDNFKLLLSSEEVVGDRQSPKHSKFKL